MRCKKIVSNTEKQESFEKFEGNGLEKRFAVENATEVKDVGISYIWLEGLCQNSSPSIHHVLAVDTELH